MPQDAIQFKLLMALSLYINTLRQHPPTLVPATSEQLFGMEINEKQDIESDECDYEYESEEVIEEVSEEIEVASSTAKDTNPAWDMPKRIVDLNDQQEPIARCVEVFQC
jgi:hypothetical protein